MLSKRISDLPDGDGWIFELELSEAGEVEDLLDSDAYSELVGS